MVDSVRVTPASRKIEFFNPTTAAAKSTISLDTSGNLTIVADGTIDIGDTSADIYVGDGSSNVDIVYTADGEIRTEGSGVELSLVSAETMSAKVPLLHISDTGTTHKTLLKLDNGLDTDGGRGVGMDFRVRFTSTNIHTSQIYFDFYGDKWTDSIGMNYVSGRSGSFSHHHFRDQAGATQLMIADDGEVGIGPSFTHGAQPDAKLHLKGSGGGEKLLIEDTGTNSNPAIEIKNDAAHWKIQNRGGDADKLRIVEDTNTLMVIQTNGNVGINDTTPTYKLDVHGTGRFTGDLTGDARIRGGYGTGEAEFNRSDGFFKQELFTTGTPATPLYNNANQNLTAVTTQGNCVRVSGSGTNASYQITAAGKQTLFNVVLSGDGSVLDTFQSFDCTVYVGDAAHNLVHRKTIKCLWDGANSTLYYSYVDEMENFTNDMFDVYVEHLAGDSQIAGVSTGNIQVARVGITVGAVNTLSPNKLTANQLDWSYEFTGLKDEAHVG